MKVVPGTDCATPSYDLCMDPICLREFQADELTRGIDLGYYSLDIEQNEEFPPITIYLVDMENPMLEKKNDNETTVRYPHLKLKVGVGVFLTPEELKVALNSTAIIASFDQLG